MKEKDNQSVKLKRYKRFFIAELVLLAIAGIGIVGYFIGRGGGWNDGYSAGHDAGYNVGHDDGYKAGHDDGYHQGTADGYRSGYDDGSYGTAPLW